MLGWVCVCVDGRARSTPLFSVWLVERLIKLIFIASDFPHYQVKYDS